MKKIALFLFCFAPLQAITFSVTNTNNSGAGSLLQAILDANANGGNCTIAFNISGPAPHIITPTAFYSTSPNRIYPAFTNNSIVLDATTQAGFVPGTPSVRIDCSNIVGTGRCLSIVGADNCVIKGIGIEKYVTGGSGRAISIENTSSHGANSNQVLQCRLGSFGGFGNTRGLVISGDASATFPISNTLIDSNVMSGNSIAGLHMQFNVINSVIQNNFFGCDYGATLILGNAYGVVFIGDSTHPCTGNLLQNNVISGNDVFGVILQTSSSNNIIYNNKIGVNSAGTAIFGATQYGILVTGDAAEPCSSNNIDTNIIGGCQFNGIYLSGACSTNVIRNNFIGTNGSDTNLGNGSSGILLQGSDDGSCVANRVENNTIKFNGFATPGDEYGILIAGAVAPDILNTILANNISANSSQGIKLLNGANHDQGAPIVDSASVCSWQNVVTISATAPTLPIASSFILDFFINTENRNSILKTREADLEDVVFNPDPIVAPFGLSPITEGARYIGSVSSVATGQSVTKTFVVSSPSVVPGNFVSATATNLNNGSGPGDTSEYSLNHEVIECSPVAGRVSALTQAIFQKYCLLHN